MAQYARLLACNDTIKVKLLMLLGKPGTHDAVSNISRLFIGGTIYAAVRIEVQLAWLPLIGKAHSGWADLPCH